MKAYVHDMFTYINIKEDSKVLLSTHKFPQMTFTLVPFTSIFYSRKKRIHSI